MRPGDVIAERSALETPGAPPGAAREASLRHGGLRMLETIFDECLAGRLAGLFHRPRAAGYPTYSCTFFV